MAARDRGMAAAPDADTVVEFAGVVKTFAPEGGPRVVALEDIDLKVGRNRFVSVVGPSGCGKSTLLNLCAGLSFPDAGRVLYGGAEVKGVNTQVGYVTQDSLLLPWRTVLQNVALPLVIRGVPRREREERAREWIDLVGLGGFEESYPHQLSGGMQKRCAIARTLVYDPEVVLMDEPFGPLDAMTRQVLQSELLQLWERRRKTILFITHDLAEAVALSDEVVALSRRPGRVKARLQVHMSRPRDVYHIAKDEGFAEDVEELWSIFKAEVAERPDGPKTSEGRR